MPSITDWLIEWWPVLWVALGALGLLILAAVITARLCWRRDPD